MFKTTIRILIGIIFVISGAAKLVDTSYFASILQQYSWFSSSFVSVLTLLIPSFELFLGLFLMIGFYTRWVSIILLILVGIFSGISFWHWVGGSPATDCGCFGSLIQRQIDTWLFVGNGLLMCMLWMIGFGEMFNSKHKRQT